MLTTHDQLLAHAGQKVTCEIRGTKIDDARIQVEDGEIYICQNLCIGRDYADKLGYKYSWFISCTGYNYEVYNRYCTNITLVSEKKPTKKPHTYTTVYRRDDGVEFTETSIGGVSIEDLKAKEQSLYAEARAIRANLNSHAKKFPN